MRPPCWSHGKQRSAGRMLRLADLWASDGVFVCNLLIKSVIEPFQLPRRNSATAGCAMRAGKALWNFTINFIDISHTPPLSQHLSVVLPVLTAAIIVNEFVVVAVPCNNTLSPRSSRLVLSVCRRWSSHASLPSGISILSSIDANGHTTASNALLFLAVSENGDFPSLSSGPGSSNVPDSELQASVFHTLDGCRCCVQQSCGRGSWSFPHHQDSPSRSSSLSRLPDVLLSRAR